MFDSMTSQLILLFLLLLAAVLVIAAQRAARRALEPRPWQPKSRPESAAAPVDLPVDQAATARRSAFQAPPSPATFAGRTRERIEASAWLLGGDGSGAEPARASSVALQGMSGIGKTALALKLAQELTAHFPGGVLWLPVGYGATRNDLIDRLALELGLDLHKELTAERRTLALRRALSERRRVLVLADDLWDAELGRWLQDEVLPEDRALLVTCRGLEVSEKVCDHVVRLEGLPQDEALSLLSNLLGPLTGYEAAAAEVCARAQGVPLALELAARVCDRGPADLPWVAENLRDNPQLPVVKLEEPETRESSVEACLALSYGTLPPDLQQRFRMLGAFAAAPLGMMALVAVWGEREPAKAQEHAERLVRRGLLQRAEARLAPDIEGQEQSPSLGRHPVYEQHSLVRAYAWALLAPKRGEALSATARHAAYYQRLAARDPHATDLLWRQVAHGWTHALAEGPKRAMEYYGSVLQFLRVRGQWHIHNQWAGTILGLPDRRLLKPQDLAVLSNNLGYGCALLGAKSEALSHYEQALPFVREARDRAGEATTLNNIGLAYDELGDKAKALEYFESAVQLARKARSRAGEARALNHIGLVHLDQGDRDQALAHFQQALALMQAIGDRVGEAGTLDNIARTHSTLGDRGLALEAYEKVLAIQQQIGNEAGEAVTLHNMGLVYDALGEKQKAVQHYEQAMELFDQLGDRWQQITPRYNLALLYEEMGDLKAAAEHLTRVVALSQSEGHPDLETHCLALARVAGMAGGERVAAG